MAAVVISPLAGQLRALRTIQAPDHIADAADKPGGVRVSSAAFKPGRDGSISVDLEESLIADGVSILAQYRSLARAVGLVAHQIMTLENNGLSVAHAPVDGNDHHGEVRFVGLTKGQLREVARTLADSCEIVEAIDVLEVKRQRALRDQRDQSA